MQGNFIVEQKLLLLKKLEEEKRETGKLSQKTKDFVNFFYTWGFQYVGYYSALTEWGKTR